MEKVHFTEEKETMLATLWGRAVDSRREHSILGDHAADEAVKRIDYDFTRFGVAENVAVAVALRAKPIDGWAADFLRAHPDATVVHLGCGMDSRVYRLDPPPTVRWFDVDYPEVVDLRERIYPEREGYRTIRSSVTDFEWLDQLPDDKPGLVIAEGLTMYLTREDGEELLRRLIAKFPSGEMIFDVFSKLGIKLQKMNPVVRKAKATLYWGVDDPAELTPLGLRLAEGLDTSQYSASEHVANLSRGIRMQLKVSKFPPIRKMSRILRYEFGTD